MGAAVAAAAVVAAARTAVVAAVTAVVGGCAVGPWSGGSRHSNFQTAVAGPGCLGDGRLPAGVRARPSPARVLVQPRPRPFSPLRLSACVRPSARAAPLLADDLESFDKYSGTFDCGR